MTIHFRKLTALAENLYVNAALLLFVRLTFASIFWRSGRTKIEDGTLFTISDGAYSLFETDFSGVPLPPHVAAVAATISEHVFPALILIGLATRLSSVALLGMTLVIQIFVFPDAWWQVHSLWVALALVLIVRGPGLFSLDTLISRRYIQGANAG